MRIQICHSSGYDFRGELYVPLRESALNLEHEIILPHESSDAISSTKEAISMCDLVVAEISQASTGLGMELAWADQFGKPIICIQKSSSNPSKSIDMIKHKTLSYSSNDEMIELLMSQISKVNSD